MKAKVGRNDPCPCGSGKKFKKCCEKKMIGKRYLAQKIDQSTAPGINKASGFSSLFQNTIASSSTRPEQSQREIKATKGKLPKEKVPQANPELPEEDEPSPHEEAPPTTEPEKQETPKEKKQPREKELPPEIEPSSEEPLDAPPENDEGENS